MSGKTAVMAPVGPGIVDVPVEQLTIRVVLPEGASNVEVELPLPHTVEYETKHTFLDLLGRKVVVLKMENYVQEQNMPFAFVPSRFAVLQKVGAGVGLFGVLFGLVLLVSGGSGGKGLKGQSLPAKKVD